MTARAPRIIESARSWGHRMKWEDANGREAARSPVKGRALAGKTPKARTLDRAKWLEYRARSPGPRKQKLLGELVLSQERLVQQQVAKFVTGTRYYVEAMREDLEQAARIGLIRAINGWDPNKGAFSTIAGFWCRHEMQQVVRHATPISRPKSADLPRRNQDAAASFYAAHGRDPDPQEIGITEAASQRAQKAAAGFVHIGLGDLPSHDEDTAEEVLDRNRDMRALKRFMGRLTASEKREFWDGKRADLVADAKRYVEGRRGLRCKTGT